MESYSIKHSVSFENVHGLVRAIKRGAFPMCFAFIKDEQDNYELFLRSVNAPELEAFAAAELLPREEIAAVVPRGEVPLDADAPRDASSCRLDHTFWRRTAYVLRVQREQDGGFPVGDFSLEFCGQLSSASKGQFIRRACMMWHLTKLAAETGASMRNGHVFMTLLRNESQSEPVVRTIWLRDGGKLPIKEE